MEKKIRSLPANKLLDEKVLGNYFKTERRVVDLETEVEHLKEVNKDYENLLKDEMQKVVDKQGQMGKMLKVTYNEENAILEAINQLKDRHDIVYEIMKYRREKLE